MQAKYVYIIESTKFPNKKYIGLTSNLKKRIAEHNSGKSKHTSKYLPWQIQAAIYFRDGKKAYKFEKYLKHGSGHAFAKKHF